MRHLLAISLIALFIALCGCSSKPASVDQNENQNGVATEPQAGSTFANITDASAAVAEGDRLMDENDTNQGIDAYKRAIEIDPDLPEAHFKLGIAYGLMELQMEQDGRGGETVDPKGRTRSEKSFQRAVEAYKKWLDANPKDDAAHYNLGRTYNKLNKDEEAEKEFRQAVKLKPDDTEYQTELGNILIKLAKYHEAIPALKKAVELDATNERAASLLEDAQAGRQRLNYIGKNANQHSNVNRIRSANTNVSANAAGNTNTVVRPSNSNTKATPRPSPLGERPRRVRPN